MALEAGQYDINAVILQVGAALDDIADGLAEGSVITITPGGDEAAGVAGAKGSAMLVSRRVTLYTITVVMLPTHSAINLLGTLRATGNAFPINYENGSSRFSGFALLQNRGEEAVDTGGGTRTFTFVCIRQADNLSQMGVTLAEISPGA